MCESWLTIYEVIMNGKSDKHKVCLLPRYLDGDAITFFSEEIVPLLDTITWDECKTRLTNRYGEKIVRPIIATNARQHAMSSFSLVDYDDSPAPGPTASPSPSPKEGTSATPRQPRSPHKVKGRRAPSPSSSSPSRNSSRSSSSSDGGVRSPCRRQDCQESFKELDTVKEKLTAKDKDLVKALADARRLKEKLDAVSASCLRKSYRLTDANHTIKQLEDKITHLQRDNVFRQDLLREAGDAVATIYQKLCQPHFQPSATVTRLATPPPASRPPIQDKGISSSPKKDKSARRREKDREDARPIMSSSSSAKPDARKRPASPPKPPTAKKDKSHNNARKCPLTSCPRGAAWRSRQDVIMGEHYRAHHKDTPYKDYQEMYLVVNPDAKFR